MLGVAVMRSVRPLPFPRFLRPCQYDCFKRDICDYLTVYLAFFKKYPNISQSFIEALILGRLTFSDQQSKSAEQLFLQMKSSNFIKFKPFVKAEPLKPDVEAESARAEGAHDAQGLDVKSEDEPVILPVMDDATLAQLVNFACEVFKSEELSALPPQHVRRFLECDLP